jgi:hypothetical protein
MLLNVVHAELLAASATGTQFTVLTQQEVTSEECDDEATVEVSTAPALRANPHVRSQ